MNTVTIHPQPRKPLTFADIPPGPFIWLGDEWVKVDSSRDPFCNAVRRSNGERYSMAPTAAVTLPDAPPQQDDTVAYGAIDPGEIFEIGDTVFQRMEPGNCVKLSTGDTFSFITTARVRRVDSVTITRDQQGAK